MKQYSLYVIGGDGKAVMHIALYCASEDDARARAQHFTTQYDVVELWEGSRMIAEFRRTH